MIAIVRFKSMPGRRFEVHTRYTDEQGFRVCGDEHEYALCSFMAEDCRDAYPACLDHNVYFKEVK